LVPPEVPRVVSASAFMAHTLLLVVSFLIFFWGGQPLHSVQLLIFKILTEDLTAHFMISSMMVFPEILPDIILLPRRNDHLEPLFLIPVMLSGFARHLLNGRPFQVPLATLSRPCP
jgi:hypothetical protein